MTIELAGLELWGYHGALEQERSDGQRFLFDLEVDCRDTTAAASDRLEDAIDYRELVAIVREISDGRSFTLLEALAEAIVSALCERLPVARARVRVRKPDVQLGVPVEHSAVVVERVVE
jgi:dihydroneopterin aldolase